MPRDPKPSFLRIILTTIAAVVGVAAVTGATRERVPRRGSRRNKLPAAADHPDGETLIQGNRRNELPTGPPREATPPVPEGWGVPQPERLAHPTYWPMVLALGIAFIFWGPVTTLFISGVGLLLFALALAGWIGELRHE